MCDYELHIIEPLDVLDFHNLMVRGYMILIDSDWIQEKVPSLGKPGLVLCDMYERIEGIQETSYIYRYGRRKNLHGIQSPS